MASVFGDLERNPIVQLRRISHSDTLFDAIDLVLQDQRVLRFRSRDTSTSAADECALDVEQFDGQLEAARPGQAVAIDDMPPLDRVDLLRHVEWEAIDESAPTGLVGTYCSTVMIGPIGTAPKGVATREVSSGLALYACGASVPTLFFISGFFETLESPSDAEAIVDYIRTSSVERVWSA
jgi:hypothetical protein